MSDKITSQTTGKQYNANKVVRIINTLQAASYMKHGAELLDIYPSRDFKSNDNKPLLVYIFDREATTPLYDAWCKRELN